jgi:hypothetical protein
MKSPAGFVEPTGPRRTMMTRRKRRRTSPPQHTNVADASHLGTDAMHTNGTPMHKHTSGVCRRCTRATKEGLAMLAALI